MQTASLDAPAPVSASPPADTRPPEPSPAVRALLASDGTVTRMLEAWFGSPVGVETLSNLVLRLTRQPAELELEPREALLRRVVILRLDDGGRPLVRANAAVALERLAPHARAALLGGAEPLGRVFGEAGLETRRELLNALPGPCLPGDAEQLEIDRSTPVFERGYRIISGSRPLALVVERIPATIFGAEL
jgi:chorismate-pyruvate lyase